MVTAASTANLAIILIDARKGVLTQTRRHSYLAHLVNIPHLIVARTRWTSSITIRPCSRRSAPTTWNSPPLGIDDIRFIPMSALNGDMVVDRGEKLDWYQGPTLLDVPRNRAGRPHREDRKFRFPVQYVCRPQDSANPELHDYRGFMGRVESGEISVGDEVTVLPSASPPASRPSNSMASR